MANVYNKLVDVGTWIKNGFSSLTLSIGGFFNDLWSGLNTWLTDFWNSITGFFSFINDFINNLWQSFGDFLLDMFVPADDFFSSAITEKLVFIEQFQTVTSSVTSAGSSALVFKANLNGMNLDVIDLSFFEPFRLKIRTMLSAIFYIGAVIAMFRLITSIFGIREGVSE